MQTSIAPAYLLFLTSLFLVVTLGFGAQAVWPIGGLAFTKILLIFGPAWWFARKTGLPVRNALHWTPVSPRIALLAVAVGATGWGVAVAIHQLLPAGLSLPAGGASAPVSMTVGSMIARLFVGAVLAGICEEVLFRGAIQGVLERRGQVYAVVVTAVRFGVFHLAPTTVIPAIFLGLVFGIIMARTGSSLAAALAHTANNAVAILVGYLLLGRVGGIPATLMLPLALGFVVFVVLFIRSTSGADVSPSPLATLPAPSW